jgi:hypothetical protein
MIERLTLPRIAVQVIPEPVADPTPLNQRLTKARTRLSEFETAHVRSMTRSGDLAARTQKNLEQQYDRQPEEVPKLERQAATSAPSLVEVQRQIERLRDAALMSDIGARAKVAAALVRIIGSLICRKDGTLHMHWKPPARITWIEAL